MIVAGFVLSAAVSIVSFFGLLAFASPQAGPTFVGLFFLTMFASVSSIAILGHIFIFCIRGISVREHKEVRGIVFRRGIFLGGFATLIFIFAALHILMPLTAAILFAFFIGAEIYITKSQNSHA